MNLIPAAIVAVLLAAVGILVRHLERKRLARLMEERRQRLEEEKRQLLEFLHDLGETISNDLAPRKLYRQIVHGVARLCHGAGGALYLHDPVRRQLNPAHVSRRTPPLVPLPASVLEKVGRDSKAIRGFVQIACPPENEGLLGEVLESGKPQRIADLAEHPFFASLPPVPGAHVAAMLAPLVYGTKKLGVLAVARYGRHGAFTAEEFHLFRAVAEQTGFALGNQRVHQEAGDKRRIEEEMRAASQIQRILMPAHPPEVAGYALAAAYQPAKIVSGDYYDFLRLDDRHLGIVVADVSGKGLPASLVMASCRSLIKVCSAGSLSPVEVLRQVNRLMFPDIREDMFISLAYAVLDLETGDLTLARAGHDPPLLWRKAGQTIEMLRPPGLAIGIDKGPVFDRATREVTYRLDPGDVLLLYTDGITEALEPGGIDQFGPDRLTAAAKTSLSQPTANAAGLLGDLQASLSQFVRHARQHDDITLVALQRR